MHYCSIVLTLSSFGFVHCSVLYDVFARGANAAGGFALRAGNCTDAETYCTSTVAGFDVCCSGSSTCFTGHAEHCCPTQADCVSVLNTSPQCADSSWTLCGSPDNYFCCSVGTICYSTTVDSTRAVGCLSAGQTLAAGESTVSAISPGKATTSPVSASTMSSLSTTTSNLGTTATTAGSGSTSASLSTAQTTTSGTTSPFTTTSSPSSTSSNAPSQSSGVGTENTTLDAPSITTIVGTVFGVLIAIVGAVFSILQWKGRDPRQHGMRKFRAARSIEGYFCVCGRKRHSDEFVMEDYGTR